MESVELTGTEYKNTENDKYENTPTVSHVQENHNQQKSYDDKENMM